MPPSGDIRCWRWARRRRPRPARAASCRSGRRRRCAALAELAAGALDPAAGAAAAGGRGGIWRRALALALRARGFRVLRRVAYAAAPAPGPAGRGPGGAARMGRSLPRCSSRRARRAVPCPCSEGRRPRRNRGEDGGVGDQPQGRRGGGAGDRPSGVACGACRRTARPGRVVGTARSQVGAPDERISRDPGPREPAAGRLAERARPPPAIRPLSPPAPKRLDPAAVMIGVGGVVLLLARLVAAGDAATSTNDASVDPARVAQLEQRLGALEGCGASSARWAAGCRPLAAAGRPRPGAGDRAGPGACRTSARWKASSPRWRNAPRSPSAAPPRPPTGRRRMSAGCRAVEAKPAFDPAAVAPRAAFDALGTRVEAQAARIQQIDTDPAAGCRRWRRPMQQREQAAQQAMTQKLAELARADEEREKARAARRGAEAAGARRRARPAHRRAGEGAEADGGAGGPHRAARRDRPAARRAAGRPAAGRGRWRGSTSRRRRWPASPSRRRRPRRRCGCPSRMRRRPRALPPMPPCSRMAAGRA